MDCCIPANGCHMYCSEVMCDNAGYCYCKCAKCEEMNKPAGGTPNA